MISVVTFTVRCPATDGGARTSVHFILPNFQTQDLSCFHLAILSMGYAILFDLIRLNSDEFNCPCRFCCYSPFLARRLGLFTWIIFLKLEFHFLPAMVTSTEMLRIVRYNVTIVQNMLWSAAYIRSLYILSSLSHHQDYTDRGKFPNKIEYILHALSRDPCYYYSLAKCPLAIRLVTTFTCKADQHYYHRSMHTGIYQPTCSHCLLKP
ncbi:hypothetical protein P153DRAFT_189106 [Dothidotthia symphoricarpi CBS 119687]|uniref:Uncharacterized protein n=1 Tax=Dothidotthia symphoricarpi CBS 119687 TaxID=1392245 RepID=A0A6A6AMH0_9PLEO|nr:uncharacterized protein P153DRAFT_189106 [Dothidotthia symphoricarpi CBS 119687]KAF2132328.1 hypothetical protein P153DRAFT_189106 [Dothidotthia symphoricarpi CBS 119687]